MKISKLIEVFPLKILSEGSLDMEIKIPMSNRCGMQLNGFYGHFEELRIQIIGIAEMALLESFSEDRYEEALLTLLQKEIPCLILTNGATLSDRVIHQAHEMKKWILTVERPTSDYLVDQTLYLQNQLAQSIRIHGCLMEVFGMGVLIKGDSGVGKSITSIELIRRGHLFVADDVVVVKKISSEMLSGEPDQLTKNLIECRGVGIVNINSLFGKSSIRTQVAIDLIIDVTEWDDEKDYSGIGEIIETDYLMGVELPIIRIPMKKGQYIPTSIIEIGALNIRQNQMGYNTAQELLKAIGSVTQ
jgi:HPr kinase/phosphorylase